ncbi:uncharacterized protein BDR25DRAFT_100006 [Lindgomyces ingoldianus]|uniref:Uncharacterized protein n=1 Tax=Lindgomyces ingoldianus TaxID=673940 RepID=A0ACB6R9V3_9PLEO|nr:uncharacterized protein BDR25DRAFT_100006 [Lindgomyces ingoldianus]KAF2475115.1 hypothetical protein BDR25DRAFT_100006 [Lindgomyces ingoldianus]
MPTLSSILLGIQAIPITLFGTIILYNPAKAGFADVHLSVSHIIGFSSLSLGTAYALAALQPLRTRHQFLLTSAPLRFVAACFFLSDGNEARGAPIWDFANAGLALVVVVWERLMM